MATNLYFSQSVKSEQDLYENLVIESLKMYGQDIFYMPRTLVAEDKIFGEDVVSAFDRAYQIEMYLENVDNFDGDQELFSKFGVEIRDRATLHVSRRRWQEVAFDHSSSQSRPNEGDLIFLPLSNQIFEIMRVIDDQPFYQLSNLPVYKLTCSLFEYSEEKFDTDVAAIDNLAALEAYQTTLTVDVTANAHFTKGEIVSQTLVAAVEDVSDAIIVSGTVSSVEKLSTTAAIITVINVGVTGSSGEMREFTVSPTLGLVGAESANTCFINDVADVADSTSFALDGQSQNYAFELEADGFLDFTESNPFGDPSETY